MNAIEDFQERLLVEMSHKLVELRFSRESSSQSFDKPFTSGVQFFHLGFVEHDNDFDATADVAVRFDDLEELINQENELLSESEKQRTCSLGAELGNLVNGKQKRWSVVKNADIPLVADSIFNAFESVGLPYLKKYSEMPSALDVLSRDDKIGRLHSPIDDARCRRAIALAFLLGDRERFDSLVQSKTQFLESRNDFGLRAFTELAEKLGQNWGMGSANV